MTNTTVATEVAVPDVSELSPAARIAVLSALGAAIKEQIDKEKELLTESYTGATKSQSIPTPFGSLAYQPPKIPVKVDEQKLLDYVKANHPDAIVVETVVTETIDPALKTRLVKDIVDVGDGDFVAGSSGEVINYAYLGEQTKPTITYSATQLQKQTKHRARVALRDRLEAFTQPLLEVETAETELVLQEPLMEAAAKAAKTAQDATKQPQAVNYADDEVF